MSSDRDKNTFSSTVENLFRGMDGFLTTKTVVGDAIHLDGIIILPLVDVSFGVGAGAFAGEKKNNSAGGMTGKVTPSAVLVIQDGHSKLISVKNQDTVSRILDMVPDVIGKFTKSDKKEPDVNIPKDVFDSAMKKDGE